MKRVCIHQPDFLPYLGFFKRLYDSDVYVIYDDVQFLRRGWHHRDKIKTRSGEAWLTLPVQKTNYLATIDQIMLHPAHNDWAPKLLNLIKENYQASPFYDSYMPAIERIFSKCSGALIEINLDFINLFVDELDIQIEIVFASSLGMKGSGSEKLVRIVQAVGGDHYITGTGSSEYIDSKLFEAMGINLEIRAFNNPVYPQQFGAFISHLSCIDALFNCGPDLKNLLQEC